MSEISTMETEQFFKDRAKEADLKAFRELLHRYGGEPPRLGDVRALKGIVPNPKQPVSVKDMNEAIKAGGGR